MEQDSRRGSTRAQVIDHKGDLPWLVIEDTKGNVLALYPIPGRRTEVEDGAKINQGALPAKSSVTPTPAPRTSPAASRA